MVGNGSSLAGTACFADPGPGWFRDHGLVIDRHDILPVLRSGRIWLYCWPPAQAFRSDAWERMPFEPNADRVGYDIDVLVDAYNDFLAGASPKLVARWFDLVSPRVMWTCWLGAALLANLRHDLPLPAADPELVELSLRSLLAGSAALFSEPSPAQAVILDNVELMYPIVADGYRRRELG